MRLCVVVKNDNTYRKIGQIFNEYEVLNNASHFSELSESVLSDDINLVIIEDGLHWKDRAEKLLFEYKIPCVIFTGNFDDLNKKVRDEIQTPGVPRNPNIVVNEVIEQEGNQKAPKVVPVVSSPQITNPIPIVTQQKETPPTRPTQLGTAEVIREVPTYIEKTVIKEVEKIVEVERIKEVPVERFIDREVTRTEVVEIKPNFDNVEIDFELPSIVPEVPIAVERISDLTNLSNSAQGPILIGIMAAENDIDISNTVFLLGTALAELGHNPLIIGDDREEILSLEQMIFENEKEDPDADFFESEGISYMRQNAKWDYSDILSGEFTHIIFWYESIETAIGQTQFVEWTRTNIPLLVFSGVKWKSDRLDQILQQFSEPLQQRVHLLLQQKQSEVLKHLEDYYPDINVTNIPYTPDPFSPTKESILWVSRLVKTAKNKKIKVKLWLIFLAALVFSCLLVWVGLQIDVPKVGE